MDYKDIQWGPVADLIADEQVSEIIVNTWQHIFFEKEGTLYSCAKHFSSAQAYQQLLEQITSVAQTFLNRDKPFLEQQLGPHRVSLVYSELSGSSSAMCLRRFSSARSQLQHLSDSNWCSAEDLKIIKNLILNRKNILVVGGTSSGKTTLLQALLNELPVCERTIIIEDTQELKTPNAASMQLICRPRINDQLEEIGYEDLIKRSLRLRPDRLVLGEIRGAEAYTFLLALTSGHSGSMGSMHASNAREALLKLEMLVQLGAPQWSYDSIRRLISLSLHTIIVLEKRGAHRRLKEIMNISSFEGTGLTLEEAALN